MDTPTNTPGEKSPTDTNTAPSAPESETGNEEINYEAEEGSRLREFISNIPLGKILLGAFLLFMVIWGVIYLFSGNKPNTLVPTQVQIEEAKKTIAQDQAIVASNLLGSENYNATLQPRFSLEPADITADEPKIALLQSAGVLEQTLNFDLWAHLSGQVDREGALKAYENKLDQSFAKTQDSLTQVGEKRAQISIDIANTELQQRQALGELNSFLVLDPTAAEVITHYKSFATSTDQIARLTSEYQLLGQTITQALPFIARAEIRTTNIQLNREAIVENIKIVDLDDPGLKLVVKPIKAN